MDNYSLLRAIYEINIETKRVSRECEKSTDEKTQKEMKQYIDMLYDLKSKAIAIVLFAFEHSITPHVYNNRTYWLVQLAGFEYHMQYIKIPRSKKKRVSVEHKDYNSVKELGIGKAIDIIMSFIEKMKEDKLFMDFQEQYFYAIEKNIRPLIHH